MSTNPNVPRSDERPLFTARHFTVIAATLREVACTHGQSEPLSAVARVFASHFNLQPARVRLREGRSTETGGFNEALFYETSAIDRDRAVMRLTADEQFFYDHYTRWVVRDGESVEHAHCRWAVLLAEAEHDLHLPGPESEVRWSLYRGAWMAALWSGGTVRGARHDIRLHTAPGTEGAGADPLIRVTEAELAMWWL